MTTAGNDAGASRASATPQFLNKLSAMVDDPATDRFIKWSDDGTSFYVFNPDQFAKELLGTYYKTDASASFVRQLNMYGFHKVPHVRQGALKSDKQAQAWHYRNPNFRRGRPDLLQFITRKGKNVGMSNNLVLQPIKQGDNDVEIDLSAPVNNASEITSTTGEVATGSPKNIDMTQIINGLSTIKRHQTLISDNLKELHSSNQALWQEAMEARERHRKHQDTINRILKFLASLFQGTATTPIRTASMNSNSSANEKNGHVVPAPRLLIKNVPEGDDDHDDRDSTPMSSVRLEEIELLDDDIPSKSEPTAALSPTVETPMTTTSPTPLSSAQTYNTPHPIPNTQTQTQTQTPNQTQVQSQPQYVFPDQNNMYMGGNYIPQADAWKMLQWLQQNQIYIPGVTYPNPAVNNAGTLTTVPPGGFPFNPMNFSNAFNTSTGQPNNMNPMGSTGTTPFPMANNNGNGNINVNQNHYVDQPPSNPMNSLYSSNNQLFNSLMPLASIATDPNPSVSMAEVAQHGNKLDQLSNNVEAMQHGIDSLIEGMGLDPLSAASLREGQDIKGLENGLNGIGNVNGNMTSIMGNATNGNGNGNIFQIPPPVQDNAQNHPQMSLSDFDLDSLLKQLGAAAAASTPPHISALSDFSQGNDNPFDSAMFNNLDMFPSNPNPTHNGNSQQPMDYIQSQIQNQNQSQNQNQGQSHSHSHSQSFGSLNEISSPTLKRSGSSEPSLNDSGVMDVSPSRNTGKKRKASTETWALDETTSTSAPAPASTQPKQNSRGSKRRK